MKKLLLFTLTVTMLLSLFGCNAGAGAGDFSFSYVKPNAEDLVMPGDTVQITVSLTANKSYSWLGSGGEFFANAHLECGEGEGAYRICAEPVALTEEVANYTVKKGESRSITHSFVIPDDAPCGDYSLCVAFKKSSETYPNVIAVVRTASVRDDLTDEEKRAIDTVKAEMAKDVFFNPEAYLNYDSPGIGAVTFDTEPTIYLLDADTKLVGKRLYRITFHTADDHLLGPVVYYIDRDSLNVVGMDYRE